jgi:hypothetical protein
MLQAFEEGLQTDVFRFTQVCQIRPVALEILRTAHASDKFFYLLSDPFFHDRISKLFTFLGASQDWFASPRP